MAIKSNSVMSRTIVGTVIAWMFRDGKSIEIDVAKLSDENRATGLLHGISQKVADAAAMSVDPETGKPATVEAKRAAMQKVIDALMSGRWTVEREGGEGGMLLEALVQYYAAEKPKAGKTRESIAAHLATMTEKQKAALRNTSAHLKPYMDALRAERGKATGEDAEALLGAFDAEPEPQAEPAPDAGGKKFKK